MSLNQTNLDALDKLSEMAKQTKRMDENFYYAVLGNWELIQECIAKSRLPEAATGKPAGHCGTRWQIDGDGNMVTLFFDTLENMEAYLVSIRSPQSQEGGD